jgi:hypothetical protein
VTTNGFEALVESLRLDGYLMTLDDLEEGRVRIEIEATAEACADCLVPETIMRPVVATALGVPEVRIELVYPK